MYTCPADIKLLILIGGKSTVGAKLTCSTSTLSSLTFATNQGRLSRLLAFSHSEVPYSRKQNEKLHGLKMQ